MRFYVIIALILSLRASCRPLAPSPQGTPEREDHRPISSQPGSLAQNGLIASLSLAGILGLSIGLTEYISSFVNRFQRTRLEYTNSVMEDTFNRDRVGLDREYQNYGLDILLNLAEKYTGIPNTQEKPKETGVDGKVTDAGGVPIDKDDECTNSGPQEDSEKSLDNKSTEEVMPDTHELEYEFPMPRLPGFPPLSEPADW